MGRESGILSTIFPKSLIRYLMTGDGTDAASESNGNLFTLPSREEENDEVVNRVKQWVNSVTLQRGSARV